MYYIWIALYGLVYAVSNQLSRTFLHGRWIIAVALLLYTVFLILWIHRIGRMHFIGLGPPGRGLIKKWLIFLPALFLPLINIINSGTFMCRIALADIIIMLSVSAVEEIFFRGCLLRFFSHRFSALFASTASSAIFAMVHFSNLFSGADRIQVFLQVLCSFSSGILYCGILLKTGSLIPCVIAHFLTNITGYGHMLDTGSVWLLVSVCINILFCIICGILLCYKTDFHFRRNDYDSLH